MAVQRKIPANIVEIITYSDTVKLFRLKPLKKLPRFKPGQFLHLAVDEYDPSYNWPDSRVFSMATSPNNKDYVDLIISVKGDFTKKIFELEKGDEVWIKLPFGIFNFDESTNRDTVLIAGGTGISPFISYLQYAIEADLDPAIHLYYGIKSPKLLIINDLLENCKQSLKNFHHHIYIEETAIENHDISHKEGILSAEDLIKESGLLKNPIFYLSGPPAMIATFENKLESAGINPEDIKFDKWE